MWKANQFVMNAGLGVFHQFHVTRIIHVSGGELQLMLNRFILFN